MNTPDVRTPDVSVVIPTRGRPLLLRRAILSALHQTHRNLEVIVVLDGADAFTEDVVLDLDEPRIRLVLLENSVGGAEARNAGARRARGRYIALLDDDDEWLPTKIERQLALADARPGLNFVVVSQYLYRVKGEPDEVWPTHLPIRRQHLSEFLFGSCGGFQTSTYLCPRELFLRVPFVRGLKKHQDWDWFLQLTALPGFDLRIVEEPLAIYWVPLPIRDSVSGKLDWRFSQGWAKSRLALITRRAYSQFLVKICVRSAVTQKESPQGLLFLFREMCFVGLPTPRLLLEFAAAIALPEDIRQHLRYSVLRWRKLHRIQRGQRIQAH